MVEVFKGTPIRRMTTGGNYVNLTADVVLLSDYEALRAELEQVKREREDLREMLRAVNEVKKEAVKRAEATERLAGARVKMPSGELCRYIEQCREISNGGEYPWWSRLAEILSALAEPAGEAEPVTWATVRVEDTPDGLLIHPDDAKEWGLQDDYPYKGTFLPDGRYRIALTTPPDASAIREALERGQAFANQVRAVTCHLNGQAYSSTVSALNYFDAALSRAALAGAKP